MLCMGTKTSLRQMNVAIPPDLVDWLDRRSDELGISKQRMVSAAVLCFLSASDDEQFEMCKATYRRYYADDSAPTGAGEAEGEPSLTERVGEILAAGEQAEPPRRAGARRKKA